MDLFRLFQSIKEEVSFVLSPKPRAIYVGWNGHNNLGDDILLKAVSKLLSPHLALYAKPYVGKGIRYALENRVDLALLGGGTLIHSRDFLHRFTSVPATTRAVFGTGVLDPEFWDAPNQPELQVGDWVPILNTAHFIGVRGPLSRRLLHKTGVTRSIEVIGDPALIFGKNHIAPLPRKKRLGINIGETRNYLYGKGDRHFSDQLIPHLETLGCKGWEMTFFPACPGDLPMIRRAMAALAPFQPQCIPQHNQKATYMEQLSKMDVFVGEKLHSVILAACTLTPFIQMAYRPKCWDFMESMDLSTWCIPTDHIENAPLADMVDALYRNGPARQLELFERVTYYKERLRQAASDLVDCLHHRRGRP